MPKKIKIFLIWIKIIKLAVKLLNDNIIPIIIDYIKQVFIFLQDTEDLERISNVNNTNKK